MIILHFVETLMGTGKEGTNDGTGETCTFAQVHGICCLQNTIFVSDVAAEIVKIVSPLTGTVSFLQTLGKLYDSFAIGAQTVDSVSLSLQDAVNNVSSVNEYMKSTVATVKQHFNMKEAALSNKWSRRNCFKERGLVGTPRTRYGTTAKQLEEQK